MQLDLDDFLLGRRSWATFIELLELLPRGGCYWAAVADDDATADEFLAVYGEPAAAPPALRGWTVTSDLLAGITDRLESLRSAFGGEPQFAPRPVSALDRAITRRNRAQLDDLEKKIFKR